MVDGGHHVAASSVGLAPRPTWRRVPADAVALTGRAPGAVLAFTALGTVMAAAYVVAFDDPDVMTAAGAWATMCVLLTVPVYPFVVDRLVRAAGLPEPDPRRPRFTRLSLTFGAYIVAGLPAVLPVVAITDTPEGPPILRAALIAGAAVLAVVLTWCLVWSPLTALQGCVGRRAFGQAYATARAAPMFSLVGAVLVTTHGTAVSVVTQPLAAGLLWAVGNTALWVCLVAAWGQLNETRTTTPASDPTAMHPPDPTTPTGT